MGVNTHVARSTGKTLALTVGDMLLGLWIAVELSHTKVNDEDLVGHIRAGFADQKVIGLDVTVDEILFVDSLDASQL